MQQLLTSCRGVLIPPGTTYKLVIDRPEVVTYQFSPDNILGQWSFSGGNLETRLNRVNVRFFDAENRYEQAIAVTSSPTFLTQDNGRILEADISLPFADSIQRADILAQHHLKQSRQGWSVQFSAPLEALHCEIMDVVAITHPTPGWEEKPFRIHAMELTDQDTILLTLQEYDDSVYTYDINTPPAIPDTALPDPFALPLQLIYNSPRAPNTS